MGIHADGLCAQLPADEQEDFFGDRWGQQRAKRACDRCPLAAACREAAFDFWDRDGLNPPGVWGGTTEKERADMRAAWKAERDALREAS